MKLKLRKNLLPRSLGDAGAFSFVVLMIPVTYCFELFTVLPSFYEAWSLWYVVHAAFGTFVALSIVTNLMAAVMVDTSIRGEFLPVSAAPSWRFCAVCESVAPPRSWHCDTCGTCILKRDHHCIFTGCCVGHYNHRYFLVFLLFMFLGTLYATYFNCFYIWNNFELMSLLAVARLLFPLAMLVFGADSPVKQVSILIFLINVAGAIFTLALLVYHGRLVLKGTVTYEHNHKVTDYNYGPERNVREVFGDRWRVAWISPFITSELPHNGIEWETNKDTNDVKNR